MIVVVDYGAANLLSITRALEAAGAAVEVSADPERILAAEGVALPGVGAAGAAMRTMRSNGTDDALRRFAGEGRPLLGVCLGMQLFFDWSEEDDAAGLGLLPGVVTQLSAKRKIPHMGWNTVSWDATSPYAETVFAGLSSEMYAYFVHSYACQPAQPASAVAWTEYGDPICAMVAQGSLLGVQFHPEKSGTAGLRLLRNWVVSVTSHATGSGVQVERLSGQVEAIL